MWLAGGVCSDLGPARVRRVVEERVVVRREHGVGELRAVRAVVREELVPVVEMAWRVR